MTPPPRRCSVFGGTPPRKRPAPHPCPSGRTKTAPLPAGRRFPFVSMPDAPHTPQHGTLRAWTAPPGLRNIYGKTKGRGKKAGAPPFLCCQLHPPGACSRPAFRSFRACRRHGSPETPGPPGPFRARAQEDGAEEGPAPQTAGFSAPQTVLGLRKIYGKPGRRTALYLRFEVKGRMPAGPFRAFRKKASQNIRPNRGKRTF